MAKHFNCHKIALADCLHIDVRTLLKPTDSAAIASAPGIIYKKINIRFLNYNFR